MQTNGSELGRKAMLVDLGVGYWEGRKKDKAVTEVIVHEAKAETDSGAWWTRTVPPRLLRPILAARVAGRAAWFRMTLPWNDAGVRILPAALFMEFSKKMRELKVEYEAAVEMFLLEYPKIVTEAAQRLGDLYKPEMFLPVERLRSKFSWHVTITPLPNAADFRVDLGEDELARVRGEIQSQTDTMLQRSMTDLWERLFGVVSRVAEKLGDPEASFKNSLIGHVRDICDLLPQLNVTGNADLERMRKQVVKALAGVDPQDLRDNEQSRSRAATAAAKIADAMKAFIPKE